MKTNLFLCLVTILFVSALTVNQVHAQKRFCMLGDASRYGWDKDNASPLTQDPGNVSVFHYNAWLNVGDFKFILENQVDWVPTWNKGANDSTLVKRINLNDPDEKFHISVAGNYSITLDTTLLWIHITPMTEPVAIDFNTVFMVGDATPNGWSVDNSTELVKNPSNPWEFSYTGLLNVGEFKFPVNRNMNWGQDFFLKVSDVLMFLGKTPDSKWNITEAANYQVIMNIRTLAISITKVTAIDPKDGTGIKNPALLSTIVNDELTVLNRERFSYEVYSISGIPVCKGVSVGGKVNVNNLGSGLYILNIENRPFKFIKR